MKENLTKSEMENKTLYKVISEFSVGNYSILEIDKPIAEDSYLKYKIEGQEYSAVPIYDFPNHIAIEGSGRFTGKTLTCV